MATLLLFTILSLNTAPATPFQQSGNDAKVISEVSSVIMKVSRIIDSTPQKTELSARSSRISKEINSITHYKGRCTEGVVANLVKLKLDCSTSICRSFALYVSAIIDPDKKLSFQKRGSFKLVQGYLYGNGKTDWPWTGSPPALILADIPFPMVINSTASLSNFWEFMMSEHIDEYF